MEYNLINNQKNQVRGKKIELVTGKCEHFWNKKNQ